MKKEARLLQVGVLGCGPISQCAHFDACRKARNAELYAICDVAPDLLAKMASIHDPRKTYPGLDDMLADPEVEAVIIATADQFHVPLALQAIKAGKHVMVEKPLGVNIEECEDLRAQARNHGRVFQIGNNRRFDPGVEFARKFITEELGEMMALKSWYCDSTYRYTMTDNLQPLLRTSASARKPAGNPKADRARYFLLTHASHLVDTARFLGGGIRWLRARSLQRFGAYCWFVEAEFDSGAMGHFDLSIPIRGDFEEGFQIHGEHGSIQAKAFLPWLHKTSEVECFSTKDGLFRRPLGEDAYTYKRQVEGFADSILHGLPQTGATLEDGIAAMRALVAIARSAATGQMVALADVTGAP